MVVLLFTALLGGYFGPLAHRVTIAFFQSAENNRGEDGHPAKHKERPVDAVNELRGIGTMAIGNEEGSHLLTIDVASAANRDLLLPSSIPKC